jgi:hypothetical protein
MTWNHWVKITDDEATLPPLWKRVIIFVPNTNLFMGWPQVPVMQFMAERAPAAIDGNNLRPYQWVAENSGNWFGQDVTHWVDLAEDPSIQVRRVK